MHTHTHVYFLNNFPLAHFHHAFSVLNFQPTSIADLLPHVRLTYFFLKLPPAPDPLHTSRPLYTCHSLVPPFCPDNLYLMEQTFVTDWGLAELAILIYWDLARLAFLIDWDPVKLRYLLAGTAPA